MRYLFRPTFGLTRRTEEGLLRRSGKSLPKIDYLLWLGSSTPAETSLNNTVLGRQEQALRAKFCAAGIDVPVISRAVGGRTIATQLSALAADISYMGNAVANGKKVGVLVNIGANDIAITDYDDMAPATRTAMLTNLNSIIDQIITAGMEPIISTSHGRYNYVALYTEWADRMYRPLIASRCPKWFKAGLAVFDYCKLYVDNNDVPNWFQADGLHPNVATAAYQSYSANQLKANAKCKAAPTKERYIFGWSASTEYFGGINQLVGAATGTFAAWTVVNTKGVINPAVSFAWSGADGVSGSVRGNSGVWDVDLTNHRLQSGTLVKNNATITFTGSFGAGYAGRTGKMRATANSSTAGRITRFAVGGQTADVNASTGINICEIPFTLDASGNITITATPVGSSLFANVNGIEIEFN